MPYCGGRSLITVLLCLMKMNQPLLHRLYHRAPCSSSACAGNERGMLWKTALAPGDHTEQYTCYVVEHLQPPARMFASLACVMLLSKGEMATMIIREATAADAEGIAHVHVASWHTTYTGIIPDDVIAQMSDPQRRLAQWQRFLAEEHPRESAFVAADDDGRIVGFARCTPTRSG